jgi:small subunit ribosomal protein S3
MGQKVHPIGFRLGQTHIHSSQWFANQNNYSKYLLEDNFLRQKLYDYSSAINKIQIIRQDGDRDHHLQIIIYSAEPTRVLGSQTLIQFQSWIKTNIQNYRKSQFFQTYFGSNQPVPKLTLRILNSPLNACFLAQFLVNLLQHRLAYRTAIKKLTKLLHNKKFHRKYKGVKIQISGRLNGAEIARSEWIREGAVPLHTLNAYIDYNFQKALTIYGILGVKVWIFI